MDTALLLYKARKGRKDRRKERLSLSLRLSGVGTVRGNAKPARRDLSSLGFGGVWRPVPESTCASLRACLCYALPCPALICFCSAPGAGPIAAPPLTFPVLSLPSSPTPTRYSSLGQPVSRPLLAPHAENERNAKIREGTTTPPLPTPPCLLLVKPFVSWRASATHAVRVASQTNAPTHTATSTGHQWFASRLTASLCLPPMSDSNHVLRYAHPHQTPHRSTCRHGEGPSPRRH